MTDRQLKDIARKLRLNVVRMIGPDTAGHFGGSCSLAEIVAVLYFDCMRHNPADPSWPGRDRFLLSKGHAALIQYAALAEAGYFPQDELDTLKKLGSRLQGHPDMLKLPGIEANTGSLGQGLSIACGMAAGLRLQGDGRVYAIVGDGELAEGQIWEAAMSASAYKLSNLTCFLDRNGLQATGATEERFPIGRHREKWSSFGWAVDEIDGHDVAEIRAALGRARKNDGPTMIIARTIKGKGIPCAENVVAFHNGAMTREQYEQTLKALGGAK
jgi:transketolase